MAKALSSRLNIGRNLGLEVLESAARLKKRCDHAKLELAIIGRRRSWLVMFKQLFDSVIYALLTAGTFGWLWGNCSNGSQARTLQREAASLL
jgi:hypothetical protein